jgi:lambda family phage portal protein
VSFQSRILNSDGTQDKYANDAIEAAWKEFSKRENVDVEGRLNLTEMCKLYMSTVAEDGEVLIRKYYGIGGKYNFQLKFYDPDQIDFEYNDQLKNGEFVKFGIHFYESGKRKGYYFKSNSQYSPSRMFIPANEIIHEFIVLKAMQKRGLPWASTALLRLNMLGGYEEAALVNARVGASKMGFFTSADGEGYGQENENGDFTIEANAGEFENLPPGVDFQSFDPAYPNGEFDSFVKGALRGISSGLNVSYHNLANDLSQVNYSSARVGELSDREVWKMLQDWLIESFLMPVFNEWLELSLSSGYIKTIKGNPFPYDLLDKFKKPAFQGRRWQWVDPLKEAKAQQALIDNRLKSRSAVIREQGLDPDDVWLEIQRENDRMKELGITPDEMQETEVLENEENN